MEKYGICGIEMFFINLQGKRDSREKRFEQIDVGNNTPGQEKIYASPFVLSQLSIFAAKKSDILKKRLFALNLSEKKKLLSWRIFRFPNAICQIDRLIFDTEQRISYTYTRYDEKIRALETDLGNCEISGQEKSIKRQKDAICLEKQKKIHLLEMRQAYYLGEKMRMITKVNAVINAHKERCLARIRLYYASAANCSTSYGVGNGRLPVKMCRKDMIKALLQEEIGEEHTNLLEQTRNKLMKLPHDGSSNEESSTTEEKVTTDEAIVEKAAELSCKSKADSGLALKEAEEAVERTEAEDETMA